jgi:hypothetical protein
MTDATKQSIILANDVLNKLDEIATQCLRSFEEYGVNSPDDKSDHFSGVLLQTYHHVIDLKEAFATELKTFIDGEK